MGMTLSFQQFIIDDEIAGMILRVVRGFEVSTEHLALDVIEKVGIGGHYLVEDHTLRHFKKETVETRLFHRENYEGWLSSGKKEIKEIATERVKNILATHEPDPLPEGMDAEFEKIIKSMEE